MNIPYQPGQIFLERGATTASKTDILQASCCCFQNQSKACYCKAEKMH